MSKHWKIIAESLRLELERERIAHYLEHTAEINEELATQIVGDDGEEFHRHVAQQFRHAAEDVRRGRV